jgi:hypothetical protein
VREARYGRELWTTFLILALLLLIAETIVRSLGHAECERGPSFPLMPVLKPKTK